MTKNIYVGAVTKLIRPIDKLMLFFTITHHCSVATETERSFQNFDNFSEIVWEGIAVRSSDQFNDDCRHQQTHQRDQQLLTDQLHWKKKLITRKKLVTEYICYSPIHFRIYHYRKLTLSHMNGIVYI